MENNRRRRQFDVKYRILNCSKGAVKAKPGKLTSWQGGQCQTVPGWGSATWYLDKAAFPVGVVYC
ncbi:hypothetical protein [Streptomyces sp. NPDC057939]|uniref:hypothetical protein n=1 Tax=Streptomyces sp. NPDC057939 TaxID=3346284 RepID=UPI0036E3ACA1